MRGKAIPAAGPEITEMHRKVFEAIKASTEYGYPITQKDLCQAVGLDYKESPANGKNGKGDHCRRLWTIVNDINTSLEFDEIIVVEDYTYRIGTKEEVGEYTEFLKRKLIKLAMRLQVMKRKEDRNLQGTIEAGIDLGNHGEVHIAYQEGN